MTDTTLPPVTSQVNKPIKFYKSGRLTEKKKPDVKAWMYVKEVDDKICWAFTFFDDTLQNEVIAITGCCENKNLAEVHYLALLEGLEWLKGMKDRKFLIHTDNVYLINTIKEWIPKWEKNKYVVSEGVTRPHLDLINKIWAYKTTTPFEMTHHFKDAQFSQDSGNWKCTIKLTEQNLS